MRRKTHEPNIYKPQTKQILYCLASSPNWVRLLLGNTKTYEPFLSDMLENKFFVHESYNHERLTIKKIAEQLGHKASEVTKWLDEIYNDLFDLNADNDLLFKTKGVKHNLIFKYLYDNTASFTVWLQQSPRQYETIYFPFVKAKVGTERYWVKDIYHNISNGEHEIDLFLNGDILNRYRELLYERALLERRVSFFEAYKVSEFEIDDRLLNNYK